MVDTSREMTAGSSDSYFVLFANCVVVRGFSRSTICDLQRGRIKIIPNSLQEVLALLKDRTVESVKAHFNGALNEGIDKYIELLIAEGFGFLTDEPHLFPPIELEWTSPHQITNAIIDYDNESNHPIAKIVSELDTLGCQALLLRFFDPIEQGQLETILTEFKNSRINSVELILSFDEMLMTQLVQFHKKFLFVRSITFYDSPRSEQTFYNEMDLFVQLSGDRIDSEQSCGIVDESLFVINQEHYTESINHNSCLNCKIGVDRSGVIKNCPSMKAGFGNIIDSSLLKAVTTTGFKEKASITKDQIGVCKHCEFRHVCTDCRAYVKEPEALYAKPAKCNYDPYSGKWI